MTLSRIFKLGKFVHRLIWPPLLAGVFALGAHGAEHGSLNHGTPVGQLIDIGEYRLYLECSGSQAPTVILESGLGESSAYWEWITTDIAQNTRVCVYDRAGRGRSDTAGSPQDGIAVASALHSLLERAHVSGPFVLVGHSTGAQYVRIFAARYPKQVAGMVLLDGQPAEAFESLPGYPAFYKRFRRISALLPSLARLGLGRLLTHRSFTSLPERARDTQRRNYASVRQYRSMRDELRQLPQSLAQAKALQGFGDRPLVVVSAAQDALEGWMPLQERLATLSTNSSHRVVPFTHDAIVTDQTAAQVSSQAIRDVVDAVRLAGSLNKS